MSDTPALHSVSSTPSFPIVGIGASAGGLEAVSQLLTHLPATLGMAYVFIQHLDPMHESLLPALLARTTSMPIHEAKESMVVEVNHVYVIAPNTDLMLTDDRLTLVPQAHEVQPHLSIDTFLRSLAESRQNQAIGVLLSGTASDGTRGFQAIKAQGGLTFAQEPSSTSYGEMPQNAIHAGLVDWIGTPEQIAGQLSRLSHHPSVRQTNVIERREEDEVTQERNFQLVLRSLLQQTKVDFTMYKPTMLKRRLLRRMALLHIDRIAAYLTYLRDHEGEVDALYQDLLIGVTSFFRDPSTYQTIRREVVPLLVAATTVHAPLRIWVPGCSTGEEVYSLAICLLEFLAERSLHLPFQIFGTDINPAAIAHARMGLYSEQTMADLSAELRERYFQSVNGSYQISKSIRDRCVFAQHNLLTDPPFSRLDLVSCRNVLIYLETEIQYKVARLFHYALLPHGVLLLGPSESIRTADDLFAPLGESGWSLYIKKTSRMLLPLTSPVSRGTPRVGEEEDTRMYKLERTRPFDLQQEVDHLLLDRYAPASVVVNAQMDILLVRGHTSPYLEAAPGRASLNLFKIVREGLSLELRTAISQARKSGQRVRKEGVQVGDQGVLREAIVEVIPMPTSGGETSFVILFEETPGSTLPHSPTSAHDGKQPGATQRGLKDRRIQQLEQELTLARQEMRSVIEELEAANEELQSANEEGLSRNEELQSLNEELETSKEEIQSSNEELLVINQELTRRNTQVQVARAFAEAIVETIREPLLVLDSDLRVQQANQAFYQVFQIEPTEVEQHLLFTLGQGEWNIPALRTLLEELLPQKRMLMDYEVEQTFSRVGRKLLILNAQRIDDQPLLLLAIEDITQRKLAQEQEQRMQELKQREEFLSIASHELKTPLTSMKGYTQILLSRFRKAGDERAATLLGRMDGQLNKLIHLIRELLDVTTIEAGKLQWHYELFDLTALTEEVIEELGYMQQRYQIQVEGTIRSQVFGDRERIGQVLTNLLSNAMKYSPAATLVCVKLQEDAETVTVSVQDFGIGIDPAKREQIFERFFRVSDPEHATFPGLGLGLYISAEIVKEHAGRIWVESQPGAGATFFFSLPLPSRTRPDPR